MDVGMYFFYDEGHRGTVYDVCTVQNGSIVCVHLLVQYLRV